MKAKITTALLTIFLSMSSWAQMISQTTDNNTIVNNGGAGQTFTATATTQIAKISVRPAAAYNGALVIYNGNAGSGTVGALGAPAYTQAGVSLAASGSGSPLQDIVLTTPFPVTSGNTYTFVFQNFGQFYLSSANPYAGGQLLLDFADLAGYGIYDFAFQVWPVVAAAPATASSIPTLSEWGVLLLSLLLVLVAVGKGYMGKGWRK